MSVRLRIILLFAAFAVGIVAWSRHVLKTRGLSLGEFTNELRRGDELRLDWRSVDGKHWQVVAAAPGEAAAVTDAREGNARGCPAGMVRIRGAFRREAQGAVTGEIERVQDAACTDWISRDFPARCRVFDGAKMARDLERFPTEAMDYCIDRFEYPNVFGEYPLIVTTFHEAAAMCKKADKRLCSENEWTFACEGEETKPYPYGFARDETVCVADRPWRLFTEGALQPRNGNQARTELDHLWQGEASGARRACRSPFGVYDMTGNVDEWTTSVNATGYRSILKGGYWGPVRARCRPSTRAHNEDFIAYQQGFRCCAGSRAEIEAEDAGADAASEAPTDAGLRPAVDLAAEWPDTRDEGAAIAQSRAAGCSAASPARGPACDGATALAGLAVLCARRWKRSRVRRFISAARSDTRRS